MIGKNVLVTGAARGIGAAVARVYAENGWRVLLHFNSAHEEAEALKLELDQLQMAKVNTATTGATAGGHGAVLLPADLSKQTGIEDLILRLKEYEVNALINNAGAYLRAADLSKLAFDDIMQTLTLNFIAPAMITGAVLPSMKLRRFGRIVNVSSIAAKYGGSLTSMHYGCAKRALEGITRTLGREGAEHNILVNTVRPGVIDTGFHDKYKKDMGARIRMIPVKRMGDPKEVARLVYFLGSETNSFITAEAYAIAGGE